MFLPRTHSWLEAGQNQNADFLIPRQQGSRSPSACYSPQMALVVFKLYIFQSDPSLSCSMFWVLTSEEEGGFPYPYIYHHSQVTQCLCLWVPPLLEGLCSWSVETHFLYGLFSPWPNSVPAFNQMHPRSTRSKSCYLIMWFFCLFILMYVFSGILRFGCQCSCHDSVVNESK